MSRPRQQPPHKPVRVAGGTYGFRWDHKLLLERNRYGETDHLRRQISIAAELEGSPALAVTVLHELLHAIDEGYDIKLDEHQVAVLSFGLEQLIPQL